MVAIRTWAEFGPLEGTDYDANMVAVMERDKHTGAQAISTVTDLQTTLTALQAGIDGLKVGSIGFAMAGVEVGDQVDIRVPYACTVNGWFLGADATGAIVIDIWKDTYANFPPTDADSITGATPPTIISSHRASNISLSGWTTAIAAGDWLRFNVDSVTTITRISLSLLVTRT